VFFPFINFKENFMSRQIIASLVCCLMLLATSAFGQINLFENRNLANWDFHAAGEGAEGVRVGDVFSFASDGRLLCTGLPYGYLATKEAYKNFKFAVEWRWPGEPTNSGVFLKITDQPANSFLPKSVEVQLRHTDAGDIWAFHGQTITDSAGRLRNVDHPAIGRFMGVPKITSAEKEPGTQCSAVPGIRHTDEIFLVACRNITTVVPTSIPQIAKNDSKLFIKDYKIFVVNESSDEIARIEGFDLTGRKVFSQLFSMSNGFSIENLDKGIYIVSVYSRTNKYTTKITTY
jgi:hypothetical protein